MQNTARFSTDIFNTTIVHEHFINDCCFGEDVGEWLKSRLEAKGYEIDDPGQEDWGWYLGCVKDGVTYMLCLYFMEEDEEPFWQIVVVVCVPFLKRIFRPKPEIPAQLRRDIHNVLESEPKIRDIYWLNLDGASELNMSARPE